MTENKIYETSIQKKDIEYKLKLDLTDLNDPVLIINAKETRFSGEWEDKIYKEDNEDFNMTIQELYMLLSGKYFDLEKLENSPKDVTFMMVKFPSYGLFFKDLVLNVWTNINDPFGSHFNIILAKKS